MSTEQNTMATMVRAFAEIIERMVKRFDEQGADHEREMAEHRASFGARTEADRKIIEGLRTAADEQVLSASKVAYVLRCAGETPVQAAQRVVKERDGLLTQVQDQRAEIERLRADIAEELNESQPKQTLKQHPVEVGEWVRKTTDGLMSKIGDKFRLESYEIRDGKIWCNLDNGSSWLMSVCEPCDAPEASHDTPAGKEAAEAASKAAQ